jgi:hypothetical protein
VRVLRLALSLIGLVTVLTAVSITNVVVGINAGWATEALLGVFEILVLILIPRGDDR